MKKRWYAGWDISQARMIVLRRACQLGVLLLFLILFLKTDYNGSDQLAGAVNIFFRLDPYLASCVMLGIRGVELLLVPSLVVILLTFFTGRGFCGWFCPMGSLLDIFGRILPKKQHESPTYFPHLARLLLLFALISSLCGFAVAGYLDPFSILVRGMAQVLYPLFNSLTVGFFTFTYQNLPDSLNALSEPVYSLLRETVLPSEQKFFQLAYLSLSVLVAVVALELLQRRFFCRNLCPLGAMVSITGRYTMLVASGGDADCKSCRICSQRCRMGAVDDHRIIDMAVCNLCYECVENCPRKIIHFGLQSLFTHKKAPSLSRRKFIGTAFAGMLLPSIKSIQPMIENPDSRLIRPPGAVIEREFLRRCIRCGECLQVCIGNALQPTLFMAGIDGMFTPVLVARTGYCEFNCTLCGQVCPTGAINSLTLQEKWQIKIGHAWFDKNRCLPYAKNVSCMVCEEHCPTPDKAIRFKLVQINDDSGKTIEMKQPYIVDDLCIGCGICETKCPLPGKAAIYVTSGGEHRQPQNSLPLGATRFQSYP